MHYEYETGNCDYVTYERYCEKIEEKDEEIRQKEIEIEDLKQKLEEHKDLINELKNLCERIFKDERHNDVVNQ